MKKENQGELTRWNGNYGLIDCGTGGGTYFVHKNDLKGVASIGKFAKFEADQKTDRGRDWK